MGTPCTGLFGYKGGYYCDYMGGGPYICWL